MNPNSPFRQLPSVTRLITHEALRPIMAQWPQSLVVEAIRKELELLRGQLASGQQTDCDPVTIAERVGACLAMDSAAQLRPVINATGIVLHTNLGRAPLAEVAALAAYEAARSYCNLELDLAAGNRSSRPKPIRELLMRLTGAESATVVNNCAAATVISLRALASGKEVIVSRGQLIEIGGGFRIPEIMAVSGAVLREVGTTNITRVADYEKAIGTNTGLLMRVHPSNYRVRGFTETPSLEEMVALARKHSLPIIDDVGSGAMFDFALFGLPGEPVVPQSVAAGADLVLCSGDKLLGGPQAGLIVGKKNLIDKIEEDPLMRAFRLDKMSLAALEATLRLYLNLQLAQAQIPTLQMLSLPADLLRNRVKVFVEKLKGANVLAEVQTYDTQSFVGGGSLPDLPLPASVVAIKSKHWSEEAFAKRLRCGNLSVVARIHDGQVCFDLRTVFASQEDALATAIVTALKPDERV